MPDSDREGFLSRWSRLKRTQGTEPSRPVEQPDLSAAPVADGPELGPDSDRPAPASADAPPAIRIEDLPKIDELTADSDFSVFLQRGVPDELKRLALRKAWTLDPAIRDFVEMAENQYDFNAGVVPGFGALDPKTDIGQLLAQATGQWKRLEEARPNDADANVVNAAPPEAAPAEPASGATSEAPSIPVAEATSYDHSAQPPENPVQISVLPSRRRHGGALPG